MFNGLAIFGSLIFSLKVFSTCTIFLPLQGIKSKNKLILRLMEQLVYPNPAAYRDKLIRFSTLNHTNYSEVGGHCTELLMLSINN